MSDQRRRGIAWVEHILNLVNVVVQDLSLGISVQQAEALRQSILKKAFSGQLVPQDPHEEPALALLARIHAARTETATKTRGATT